MGNGSGRLVDNLAESLINTLGDRNYNLTNSEKFGEFMELLHEVLDKQNETEQRDKTTDVKRTKEAQDMLAAIRKYFGKDGEKEKEEAEKKKEEKKKLDPAKRKVKEEKEEQKSKTDRMLELIEKMPKSNSDEIKRADKRSMERSVKMERSIKKTIKSRVGKLWSIFKKLLIVGLLLFFAPVLKNAFSKMADVLKSSFQKFKDLTEPLWRPFIEWFQSEFPMLTDYIKEMAGYVKKIGGAIKLIADGINSLIEWKEEHSTLSKGIEGALVGASMGAVAGSIVPGLGNLAGAILGGLLGFGVGAGKSLLEEKYKEENAAKIAEEEKQVKGAAQTLAYYDTDEGKAALRGNAERSVDADISHGWISRENRDAAIEEDIKWRIDSERWTADGKIGNEPKRADYMQKFGYLENVSNPLSVEDVDLEGANHTSTDTAVEDGGASGGSGVAMQNIESHSQVTIIQNLHQANEGLDNR